VPDSELRRHGLDHRQLPLWNPAGGDSAAFFAVPDHKIVATGLRRRPLAETVDGVVDWLRRRQPDDGDVVGPNALDAAMESAVLRSWSAREQVP
jgi:hypothetical protein